MLIVLQNIFSLILDHILGTLNHVFEKCKKTIRDPPKNVKYITIFLEAFLWKTRGEAFKNVFLLWRTVFNFESKQMFKKL